MRYLLIFILVLTMALFMGCEADPVDEVNEVELPVMGMVEVALAIDGSSAEYPADPVQELGMEIYLAHDGDYFYVHVQAESEGWVSVGLNSRGGGMDGANMIIGYDDEGTPAFRDDAGRGRTHAEAAATAVDNFYFSRDKGIVVMEFAYPLSFPDGEGYNIEEMLPGETYTMILALHSISDDISRQHSERGSFDFTVEP